MIIGGEHVITPKLLLSKTTGYINSLISTFKNDYYINFTFGGFYSLIAIIDEIKLNFDSKSIVLLPSYLCPSILKPFKFRTINYKFYKVDSDLFIDNDYLASIIDENVKAIFIIDYFGISQFDRLETIIKTAKSKNILIIQDIVQCIDIASQKLYGNYIFNSFRKFFPFEGSIILSKEKMNTNFSNSKTSFIKYKRIGQVLRYFHLKYNVLANKHFLSLFKKAEDHYYSSNILKIPRFNIKILNKIDIESVIFKQKNYFNQLYSEFSDFVPNLLHNKDICPLGFIIKLNNRNEIRQKLFELNIFSPIHWILSEEITEDHFDKSIELSNEILTIPLIGLTDKKYKYLLKTLKKIITNESLSESLRN